MANYFSLPLEIRQQILFEAFALCDQQDAEKPLREFREFLNAVCLYSKITDRLFELTRVQLADDRSNDSYKLVQPLRYSAKVAELIQCLCAAHPAMGRDLYYVVNKW